MFFVIWAILIFLILGALIKKSRRVLYDDFSANVSKEEFSKQMERLAFTMTKLESHGKGVETDAAAKYVNKAYRIIKRKVIKGEELYEFEKWLYDNHYLFKRIFQKKETDSFFNLPHAGAVPRVILLARSIISLSEGEISRERVNSALAAVEKTSPLTYEETANFEAALRYAILEKISSVSRKCVYYRKMLRIAVRAKNVVKKYAGNNIYIYYTVKKNPLLADKLKTFLDAKALQYDNVDYTFSALIVENNVLTSALVTSLNNLQTAVADKFRYMPSAKIMEGDSVYEASDTATKKLCLAEIGRASDKLNLCEEEYAKRLINLSQATGTDVYNLLFNDGKSTAKSIKEKAHIISKNPKFSVENAYFILNIVIILLISAAGGVAALNIGAGIASAVLGILGALLPSYFIANKITALFTSPRPVCRTNYEDIPDNAKTEVIVPVYVTNAEKLRGNIVSLQRLSAGNRFSNLRFTLLIDFAACKDADCVDDARLLKIIKEEMPKGIGAAVRKRVPCGNKYCGYERKRGAVMQYVEYLQTGRGDNFIYISQNYEKPVFAVVLDADSELAPQAVLSAVNAFLHPMNESYDILAFQGRTNLFDIKSVYSHKFAKEGGEENYPQYGDVFFNLTKNALFCGKGIFRVQSFYEKLNGFLPENKILSHDIIEGALLETGLAGVSVYEDAPQNFRAEENRRLRWLRGDVQLLPFIRITKPQSKNNKMRLFYRYLMFYNAFSAFFPVYIVTLFLFSAFMRLPYLAVFAACVFSLEFVFIFVAGIFSVFTGRRLRYFIKDFILGFAELIVAAVLLPYKAVVNSGVFFATLFKMTVTKKGLLNWQPFADVSEREIRKRRVFSQEDKNLLTRYAEGSYGFFTAAENARGIVGDHYTAAPSLRAAKYTSPTDIGFSVIAEAAAFLLQIKGREDAERRAFEIIYEALKLKKWNGHLYNWYDTQSGKPLSPSFVSSVDSGNFIACLLTAAGVFGGNIAKTVQKYVETVDFKALFDKTRGLFYIGYNGDKKKYEGHYDNLVSEARILCYLGVSFGLPKLLWDNLSRDFTSLCGNTLLSWGGTAFEYLMSDLFISPPNVGLLRNTSKNAVKIMRRTKCKGLFGISEGGYFDFDDNGNYKYKAFGVDSLGLKSELNKCIITPYSSFLMLPYAPRAAMRNLAKLEKKEAYGEFGFYEAVDFTSSPRLVLEYMAHHQGMTLAAICNALTDGALSKAFFDAAETSSAKILLTERQYEGKAFKPEKNKFVYGGGFSDEIETPCDKNSAVMKAAVIKNGDYTVVIDDFGEGYSLKNGVFINALHRGLSRQCGAFFYVKDGDGNVNSPCRAPLQKECDYKITLKKNEAVYENLSADLSLTVYAPAFFSGEMRKLKITNDGDTVKKYKVYYYTELCLNDIAAYESHRAFSNVFVQTEIKDGALFAKRRGVDGKTVYAALYVKGAEARYVSNRKNFIGRGNSSKNPEYVFGSSAAENDDNGTVIDPCFAFCAEVEVGAGACREIEVFTLLTDSREEGEEELRRASNPHFSELIKKIPFVAENNCAYLLDRRFTDVATSLIPRLLYEPYSQETLYNACKNHKLFTELTDNFTKKTLLFKYSGEKTALKNAVGLTKLCISAALPTRLIVWYDEKDEYFAPVRSEISSCVNSVIGRDVILVPSTAASYQTLADLCFADLSAPSKENIKVFNPRILQLQRKNFSDVAIFQTGEGYFAENSYVVTPLNGKNTILPYSNVICGENGGAVTGDGGGYTYYGNSRESKLTTWENDFTENPPSELLFFAEGDDLTDILRNTAEKHGRGITVYSGECARYSAVTRIYLLGGGGAKVYEVEISAKEKTFGKLIINLNLALGTKEEKDYIFYKKEEGIYEAVNLKTGISCYLRADGAGFLEDFYPYSRGGGVFSSALGNIPYGAEYDVSLEKGECGKYYFVFGGDFKTVNGADIDEICRGKEENISYFENSNPFFVKTDDKATDILFNYCLPYQVVSSRVNGRTSLYQAGGAKGFRDILQDAMTLIYTDKNKARNIITDCASHVYYEGDVMHWWHNEKHGVRTRISDDRLFLPYVAAEYAEATGDYGVFEEEAKYLNSTPLAAGEKDRYENPPYHKKTDTVLLHIERIMESAYKTGENGLLLIGGGDWNDALNEVGTPKAGESVWLTEFYIAAASRMCELYTGKEKLVWIERITSLKQAVANTFTGKQFKRLITASGEWLGDGYGKEMKVDIISQAWAALADICDKKYIDIALNTVKNTLFDNEKNLIMLLAPPFNGSKRYGYISSYPCGVRENGGQYTHGAIWYLSALVKEGRADEAYALFEKINPVAKCVSAAETKKYGGEPYVLAGDVYSGGSIAGRAGWTWYTGSASWCYKLILEGFFGVKLIGGKLSVKPNLPSAFNNVTIKYAYEDSVYTVKMVRCGRSSVVENGVEYGGDLLIPLRGGENRTFTVYF